MDIVLLIIVTLLCGMTLIFFRDFSLSVLSNPKHKSIWIKLLLTLVMAASEILVLMLFMSMLIN